MDGGDGGDDEGSNENEKRMREREQEQEQQHSKNYNMKTGSCHLFGKDWQVEEWNNNQLPWYMTDEMADCQDTQDQRGYTKTNRRTQQTATPGFTEIFIVAGRMYVGCLSLSKVTCNGLSATQLNST